MQEPMISLLYKLKDLEEFLEQFYKSMAQSEKIQDNFALKNTAAILAQEEMRHAKQYNEQIDRLGTNNALFIDHEITGQADYFLITLKQSVSSFGIMTPGQLIAMAIDCENKQVFLLTKILEMLKNQPEAAQIREVFTYLLEEEKKHCENLQPFIAV